MGDTRIPPNGSKWFGRCGQMSLLEMEERTYERKQHNSFGYIYICIAGSSKCFFWILLIGLALNMLNPWMLQHSETTHQQSSTSAWNSRLKDSPATSFPLGPPSMLSTPDTSQKTTAVPGECPARQPVGHRRSPPRSTNPSGHDNGRIPSLSFFRTNFMSPEKRRELYHAQYDGKFWEF